MPISSDKGLFEILFQKESIGADHNFDGSFSNGSLCFLSVCHSCYSSLFLGANLNKPLSAFVWSLQSCFESAMKGENEE